jgi:tRNA (cmo5U34)-methyltransferase
VAIDLGTGTGSMAAKVLQRFSQCKLTRVDMTDITYVERDFYELELPEDSDAVVSSLALHHLVTGDDKRDFYGKVLRSLRPGGVFVNADAVLSADGWVDDLNKRKWVEFMRSSMGEEEVNAVLERHRQEDSLPVFTDQLKWIAEVGFSNIDVIWKDHTGAVVWARR